MHRSVDLKSLLITGFWSDVSFQSTVLNRDLLGFSAIPLRFYKTRRHHILENVLKLQLKFI